MQYPVNRAVLEINTAELGPDHMDTLGAINSIAVNLITLGEFDEAMVLMIQLRERHEKLFGTDNAEYLVCLNNLGNIYFCRGASFPNFKIYVSLIR